MAKDTPRPIVDLAEAFATCDKLLRVAHVRFASCVLLDAQREAYTRHTALCVVVARGHR
jgi:hypothetical protein